MRILPATLIVCALSAAALPAEAQIYSWRDASGTLVLSNTPRAAVGEVTTYAVRGASDVRTTARPALPARQRQYDYLIEEHARTHGVSPDLVRAVIQAESNFNPRAVSSKGAMGLMQLMPATARELGVSDPFQPGQNIRGGVTYLRRLLDQYGGNEELALAAYNAGPGAVDRYGAVPPYRETRDYIERIRNHSTVRKAPATRLYRKVEIVNGREVVTFTSTPSSEATLVSVRKR